MYNYLSIWEFKLIHVSKRGSSCVVCCLLIWEWMASLGVTRINIFCAHQNLHVKTLQKCSSNGGWAQCHVHNEKFYSMTHHVHARQIPTQLISDDTCQIWTWFKVINLTINVVATKISITENLTTGSSVTANHTGHTTHQRNVCLQIIFTQYITHTFDKL